MSQFLRKMTALSKKPSDFQPTEATKGETPLGAERPTLLSSIRPQADQTVPDGETPLGVDPPAPLGVKRNTAVLLTAALSPDLGRYSPKQVAPTWVSLTTGFSYDAARVARVDIAQQAMSLGEERFYETIWRCSNSPRFQVLQDSKTLRRFRAGTLVLSKIARLNQATVKDLLPKLLEKRILREVEPGDVRTNTGKTYEIYSYQEILMRQRDAGLLFVVKNGRAVEFVRPMNPRGETPPGGDTHLVPGGDTEAKPRGDTHPHIDNETEHRQRTSSTTDTEGETPLGVQLPAELLIALEALIPEIDAGAASRIWEECRQNIPDVTPMEVAYFFGKRLIFLPAKRIENPTGLMIATVRDWITPRKVQERREALAQAEERRRQDVAEAAERFAMVQAELARGRR
jgi:hypothetical protein